VSTYENIAIDIRGDGPRKAGVIRLIRAEALNALNDALIDELECALSDLDGDREVGAIVLTWTGKTFEAGAGVAAMERFASPQWYTGTVTGPNWDILRGIHKAVIAAVDGFAVGSGCELMMACDLAIAAESAKFGQPEIKLGLLPGAGGTQRLPRAIGKAKAMDLILTGRIIDAVEAERAGLISRVVPSERLLPEALEIAETISALGPDSIQLAKEAVNRSFEGPLSEGMRFERLAFQAAFGTPEQIEGMTAFLERRNPSFGGGSL
jgi:enoyl-CoA hydratase